MLQDLLLLAFSLPIFHRCRFTWWLLANNSTADGYFDNSICGNTGTLHKSIFIAVLEEEWFAFSRVDRHHYQSESFMPQIAITLLPQLVPFMPSIGNLTEKAIFPPSTQTDLQSQDREKTTVYVKNASKLPNWKSIKIYREIWVIWPMQLLNL